MERRVAVVSAVRLGLRAERRPEFRDVRVADLADIDGVMVIGEKQGESGRRGGVGGRRGLTGPGRPPHVFRRRE